MSIKELEEIEIEEEEDAYYKFKINKSQLIIFFILIAFAIGLLTGYFVWGQKTNPQTSISPPEEIQINEQNPQSQNEQAIPTKVQRYDVPVDDDPYLGAEDAPITIIEFSDFECPYCTKFHIETFSELIDEYGDQIRFVYRDFPLTSIHSEAFPAAEAANCSGDQGKYWEFHDKLFVGGPNNLSAEIYLQYAEDLNLNMDQFEDCVSSRKYQDEVQADLEFALSLGVRSTPTFFVNGIPLIGAQPFEMFSQLIESELAGEIP